MMFLKKIIQKKNSEMLGVDWQIHTTAVVSIRKLLNLKDLPKDEGEASIFSDWSVMNVSLFSGNSINAQIIKKIWLT